MTIRSNKIFINVLIFSFCLGKIVFLLLNAVVHTLRELEFAHNIIRAEFEFAHFKFAHLSNF